MIDLLPYTLARLEALHADPTRVDAIPVAGGALPPAWLLKSAEAALREGALPRWSSAFAFVATDEGRIVGSGAFKGPPEAGWVEIGYGVAAACQGRGHATAGVAALVRLAFAQPEVLAVYAETSVVNIASQRVVVHAGFAWAGERSSAEDGPVDCWFIEAPPTGRRGEAGAAALTSAAPEAAGCRRSAPRVPPCPSRC